jgi:hypothetical protein
MDITKALAPKSDQKNADDFLSGPQTFTVESVTEGTEEQPVNINLVGHPGTPYKPSKSMLRVLAKLWGTSGAAWAGRSLTLYTDPTVKFGGVTLGGIKISHLSHISKREQVSLTVTRGKKGTHTVEPLPDAPAPQQAEPQTEPWRAQWQAITNALTAAGYDGDGPHMLATAGQIIGATWAHPNKITAEDAQKILAAVREDNHQEQTK